MTLCEQILEGEEPYQALNFELNTTAEGSNLPLFCDRRMSIMDDILRPEKTLGIHTY